MGMLVGRHCWKPLLVLLVLVMLIRGACAACSIIGNLIWNNIALMQTKGTITRMQMTHGEWQFTTPFLSRIKFSFHL
ncbi:hypothetical protein GLYMA_08G048301v4 [Glycine max]|nr:hypothetical protein GLYMA_08G048301v4 [Glycine max]KAH1049662.1 hypothetical protein GYH30_020263 [Glycine max]